MNKCPKCGQEAEGNFCSNCGTNVTDTPKCPKCDSVMTGRFCSNCGYDKENPNGKTFFSSFIDKAKNVFNKCKDFVLKHKKAFLTGIIGLACVIGLIVLIVCMSNIYRVGKVSQIEIGMSEEQVINILGEPTEKSEWGEWYWYEDKVSKKIDKAETMLEESLNSGNESKIEKAIEKYDKMYEEIEEITYKMIIVNFDITIDESGNEIKKVSSVFLDKKHFYNEDSMHETTEKETKKVELYIGSVNVKKTINKDNNNETFEIVSYYAPSPSSRYFYNFPDKTFYSVKYKDGSYYSTSISIYEITISNVDSSKATLNWSDKFGEYSATTNFYLNATVEEENGIIYEATTAVSCSPSVKSIVFREGTTNIKDDFFKNCTNLSEITIPSSITSGLANSSLSSCPIEKATIPIYAIRYIPKERLTTVIITDGTAILADQFKDYSSLSSITIPDSITEIGSNAFSGCTSLENVNYSGTLEQWCSISFGSQDSNPMYYAENLQLTDSVVTELTELTISNAIDEIKNYAFLGFDSLTKMTISNSVHSIGVGAFWGCSSLTNVTLPDHLNKIGSEAFADCKNLASISLPNGLTSVGSKAFKGCSSIKNIIIPDSVTSIGIAAFSDCSKLESLTIPFVGVYYAHLGQFLGTENFDSNSYYEVKLSGRDEKYYIPLSLKNVILRGNTTEIGESAFYGCTSLTSVTIGDSITTIGNSAFSGCTSLTSVTIPDSVTSIGWYAFSDCTSLKEVHISDISAWCNIIFRGGFDVHYNRSYEANPLEFAHNLYLNGKLVTELIIPDTVTSISSHPFRGCTSLTSVTIPNSVTTIGGGAFSDCTSLTSVTIPNSVTTIEGGAFSGCTSLTSVTIPDSVTSIGLYAFSGCTSLKEVHISDISAWCNIIFRGGYDNRSYEANPLVFAHNLYLNGKLVTELTIPDTVTSIISPAFIGCTSLTSVTIPDSVTTIGGSTFYGCTSLTSVTIPDSVTTIGGSTFYGCTSLTSVTIPDSVTTIGGDAFYGCTSLTVYCEATSKPSGWSSAWNDLKWSETLPVVWGIKANGKTNEGLLWVQSSNDDVVIIGYTGEKTEIEIPSSINSLPVAAIGRRAFYGCDSLTSVTFDNPNGWWRASSFTATSGYTISSSNLSNTSTAATYLKSTYYNYYWKRS